MAAFRASRRLRSIAPAPGVGAWGCTMVIEPGGSSGLGCACAVGLFGLLLLLGLVFLGIRGRTSEKSPILVGTAFFSNNPFINQLGLNPVFTLLRSWLDSNDPQNRELHWINDEDALREMSQMLHHDKALDNISPIARMEKGNAMCKGRNIVLVMIEGIFKK